jgi:hypothetical protein
MVPAALVLAVLAAAGAEPHVCVHSTLPPSKNSRAALKYNHHPFEAKGSKGRRARLTDAGASVKTTPPSWASVRILPHFKPNALTGLLSQAARAFLRDTLVPQALKAVSDALRVGGGGVRCVLTL